MNTDIKGEVLMSRAMEKGKLDMKYVSLLFCLILVYVIPISSTLSLTSGEHGTIFYYLRLLILPLAMICIFVDRRTKISDFAEYLILLLLMIGAYFAHNEIPTTSVVILTSAILFDKVVESEHVVSDRTIRRITFLHLIQVAIMSYLYFVKNGIPGVLNSGKDPNYTGYFLIILYFMNGSEADTRKIQARDILLLLAVFTYSRTALIAVFLIYTLRIINFNNSKFAAFITKKPLLVFVVAEIVWLILCKLFVIYFENCGYVYQFRQGIDRFKTLVDSSNNMRAAMNTFLVEDLNLKSFLFGYTADDYNNAVLKVISRVNNPHNAFLAIYLQSGAIFGCAIIRRITRLFSNSNVLAVMFIIYLVYALVLGPSTYYSIESILILVAVMIQKKKVGEL